MTPGEALWYGRCVLESPSLRVSLYQRANDTCPIPRDFRWPELVQALSTHTEAPPNAVKKELPAFSFAEYPPGCTSRHLKHVRCVHGAVFDLDNVPGSVVADWLERAEGRFASLLYTTWSHGLSDDEDSWRARVVLPFSRPVPVERWPSVWHSICDLILATAPAKVIEDAAKCRDASHLFFGPICPAGTLDRHTTVATQGAFLDALSLPAPSGPMALLAPADTKVAITRERLQLTMRQWSRRKGWERWAESLRAVIAGEPFAEPGNRDNATWQLCCKLADAIPEADPERLAEHFVPSLALMGNEPTLASVVDKLERAYREAAVKVQELESHRAQRIREAFAHVDPDRDWGYLEHEIEEFSKAQGCSKAELRHRWILQRGSEYRFLVAGKYSAPYGEKEATAAALRELAPAETAGVVLRYPDGTCKGAGMLVQEYGTAVAGYCYDLSVQVSAYDPAARTYREACAPLRELKATFDPEVATWLELLSGPTHHLPLLTWLAHVADMRRTAAALMVTGPPGIGKSLLCGGLARLWTKGNATTIEQAFAGFNEALVHCPLVVSDEIGIPRVPGKSRTNEFRRLVADHARDLRKKFAHDAQLFGCVRAIIVANNSAVLSFDGEHLTDHDIAAVAERIYHIDVPTTLPKPDWHESVVYLRTVSGGAETFVTKDRLAKHVLWLRDHAKSMGLEPKGRFLIGDDGKIARTMTYRTSTRSLALEWIANFLLRKGPKPPQCKGAVFTRGGELYVQPRAMLDAWSNVMPETMHRPDLAKFAQAVAGLASDVRKAKPARSEVERTYYVVNPEILTEWSNWTQQPTDELEEALRQDSEPAGEPHP